MSKVIAFISTTCLVLFFIATIAYVRLVVPGRGLFRLSLDSPALVREVRQLSELTSVRYSIQKVVGLQQPRSLVGSESILLMVQAKVLAGTDLGSITQYDVQMPDAHTAKLRLPPPRILETFLNEKETKVWDRRITWWTPWVSADPDLEHKARMQALEDVRAAALQMGILKDAQQNAERDIRKVLEAFGITAVTFTPFVS